MKTEHDFLTARGKIAAKINKLESELKYWRDELGAFDRVETTMLRLNTGENGDSKKFTLEPSSPSAKSESAVGLRIELEHFQANPPRRRGDLRRLVLHTVKTNPGPLSAKEVERTILKGGYKPAGKNFGISVYKTLKRLAAEKEIALLEREGRLWFSATPVKFVK